MILVLPMSLTAQDSGRGMLHSQGGTWINHAAAPESSVIFVNDVIQTDKDRTASIEASGFSITVEPETIVQFGDNELSLDHGGLLVSTATALKVRVDCLTVIPVTEASTQYEVIDVDGKVEVYAIKKDVNIRSKRDLSKNPKQSASQDATVHESETATRDQHCPATARVPGSIDAERAFLNTWWAKGAGTVAIGVILCKAFCFASEPPLSNSTP
jgi:hypothetical protein